MNYIQPFLRPINFTECIKYTQKYKSLRRRYENFKIEMLGKNKSIDEINYIWNENYGKIPPEQPIRFYHCKISNDNITMLVTVKENVDYFNNNKLQFEVVKLNKLILTKFDKDNIYYSNSGDIINQNKTLFNLYIQSDTENIKTTSKVEIDKEALNFSQLYGQVIDKEDFFILNKEETSTYSLYNSITLADELAIDLNNVTIALKDRLSTATKATTSTADIKNNDFILNQPKEEIIKNKFLILKYPYNNPNENMNVVRSYFRNIGNVKLQEMNKKERQSEQIDAAVLQRFNEYNYILDNKISDYDKFCMYVNQNEGYEFISSAELIELLEDN